MALKQPGEIRAAYAETATAEEYVDKRFASAWGSVLHAGQVRAINRVIQQHGAERVLEIAPGPGRLSAEVTGFSHGYLCEFNASMVQVARRRVGQAGSRWRLVRGDGFHLPFSAEARFDLVYSFRFIRHFEPSDRTALYAQIHSVLRPGGLVVFDAVNVDVDLPARTRNGPDASPIHDVFYTRQQLQDELRGHGFEPVAFVDIMRHWTLQRWIQIVVAPRSQGLARRLIASLEHIPGDPLEWVVTCRKL
jgi:SAM-dependent methyltransferase